MNSGFLRHLARSLGYAALVLLSSPIASPQSSPPSTGNDNEVRFKAETNLVLVPVVARDSKGNAVGNLRKEDFQLFDKGKPQVVTQFAVEETSGQVAEDRSQPVANAAPANGGTAAAQAKAAAMVIPEHYVALLFDDQHFKPSKPGSIEPPTGYIGGPEDLGYARDAARKMLTTLKPADRVGVFTSSGDVRLDFTADRAKIEEALLRLRPGKSVLPTVPNSGLREREVEEQTEDAVNWCRDVVRRMSHLPGQRTVVFISPGMLLHGSSWSAVGVTMNLIDQAIRSRVVINSLDARGLAPGLAGPFSEFQARITDGTGSHTSATPTI